MTKRIVNKKLKELDIKFGGNNEDIGKELIEDWLGVPLRKYKDKYSTFDFYNTEMKILVELKSRRNDSKKYKTQLVGKNKIKEGKKALSNGYKVYYFWLLTDGLFVYQLCKNHMFETSYLGNFKRNDKSKELCLINNNFLQKTIPKEKIDKEKKKNTEPYQLVFD